ncbi:MAG: nitroreductase [Firmicutes bacterium]|nr:nitroreductase [Bacillota bacterium]
MNIYDVIKKRRSVRRYSQESVPEEKIQKILEAARWAPSWVNSQCWQFVVVQDPKQVSRLCKGTIEQYINAPAFIVGCGHPESSGKKGDQQYYMVDVALALEHLVLAATAEGLGTCWLAGFKEEYIREVLEIPANYRIVAMIALGYPEGRGEEDWGEKAKQRKPLERKPLSDIVHRDRW